MLSSLHSQQHSSLQSSLQSSLHSPLQRGVQYEFNNYHNNNRIWWSNKHNQQQFMSWFANKLQINHWQEWYSVTRSNFISHGAHLLLDEYRGVVSHLVSSTYPQHPWQLWMFEKVPHGFWDKEANRLSFMNWLYKELDYNQWEDWYQLRVESIIERRGGGLLKRYHYSPSTLLQSIYPQHPWKGWRFGNVHQYLWSSITHQRQFMDWLSEQLHIIDWQDWYKVSPEQIIHHGGSSLLNCYGLLGFLLPAIYPQYSWKQWRFEHDILPRGYWNQKKNELDFMNWLGGELNITCLEDWLCVNHAQIAEFGGRSLLNKYNGAIRELLHSVYPDFPGNLSLANRGEKRTTTQSNVTGYWLLQQQQEEKSDEEEGSKQNKKNKKKRYRPPHLVFARVDDDDDDDEEWSSSASTLLVA